jgi:hypothetical protein
VNRWRWCCRQHKLSALLNTPKRARPAHVSSSFHFSHPRCSLARRRCYNLPPSLVKSFSNLRLFLFVCSFCHFVLYHTDLNLLSVALALSYSTIPLVSQDLFFSDPLPAICFMLWLSHIHIHIYEVPYSLFDPFLMRSSFMSVFYPPPSILFARAPLSFITSPLSSRCPSNATPLPKDGSLFVLFFDTLPPSYPDFVTQLKSALSVKQSNAVCPVAVLYLDMALFLPLKSTFLPVSAQASFSSIPM